MRKLSWARKLGLEWVGTFSKNSQNNSWLLGDVTAEEIDQNTDRHAMQEQNWEPSPVVKWSNFMVEDVDPVTHYIDWAITSLNAEQHNWSLKWVYNTPHLCDGFEIGLIVFGQFRLTIANRTCHLIFNLVFL